MWNKIFKKKQSKQSNKSQSGDVAKAKRTPTGATTKCFSFRSGRKSMSEDGGGDRYTLSNENFPYLQYESEIYMKPDFNADNGYSHLYQPEQHQRHQLDENQQINEIFIEIPPPNMRLDLCPVCSRRFAPETLLKHIIICERINTKKRKPFDSSRQRLKGTEFIASAPTAESATTRISPPKVLQRKASETSLKSQPAMSYDQRSNYDTMSRKSSTVSLTSSASRPLAKRVTTQPSPEKCPYCERVFGFKAYDRHVEWCKEKSLIKPNPDPKAVSIAKERLKTRVNYKAPNLKTKRGVTREKYSNSCNGSTNSLAEFDSTLNSMSSSITSENGYDPFMNAKKQLAELFSPTTPSTQMINSMMTTPTSSGNNSRGVKCTSNNNSISGSTSRNSNNDIMSKSLISPKTPQPIPKMQSNFRRTSSLRISNRKPKPTVYTPPVRSNVHCGITDDGPISPNFVKATDYDELPIKSPYSAIKMCEKSPQSPTFNTVLSVRASPSPTLPTVSNNNAPVMREKGGALLRKNLKLDLKNPHMPSTDYPLSKTDSLALFLKYENDLAAEMSEKERKDKSNSLSKRSATLNSNFMLKDQKLPDINGKSLLQKALNNSTAIHENTKGEIELITIDKLKTNSSGNNNSSNGGLSPSAADSGNNSNNSNKSHSAPVKLINACDNLPLLSNNSDKSRSPSLDNRESPEKSGPSSSRRSGSALRRKMKYNMDNILFDIDPSEVKSTTPPSSSDNSNNNSLIRPESRASNTESIFEDFDFDQFIASFTDDEKFPIFKDYKMLLNKSVKVADEENNNGNSGGNNINKNSRNVADAPKDEHDHIANNASQPIAIKQQSPQQQHQQQLQHRNESEMSGMEKLDNLCKMLSGNSDSDDSNADQSEQTVRSKSSADSAYGSLSRQSQSPLDYRKIQSNSSTTSQPNRQQNQVIPPPIPQRQALELKTTEIVLSPVTSPNFQETMMIPRNGNHSLIRSVSSDDKNDSAKLSKFCHECGYKFVVATAKFCIECGVRRIKI